MKNRSKRFIRKKIRCEYCGGKHDVKKCQKYLRYRFLEENDDFAQIMIYVYKTLHPKKPNTSLTNLKRILSKNRNYIHLEKLVKNIIDFGIENPVSYIDFCNRKFTKDRFYEWKKVEKHYNEYLDYIFSNYDSQHILNAIEKVGKLKNDFEESIVRNRIYSEVMKGRVHPLVFLHCFGKEHIPSNDGFNWIKWKSTYKMEFEKFLKKTQQSSEMNGKTDGRRTEKIFFHFE